ncbi:MAG: aromatic acid exporter family protein [Faecousia sp.]
MKLKPGLRTVKTALAVVIALALAELFGRSDGKLIFAVLGVMAAVQPTFKESWESCLTQIVGVVLGAAAGLLLGLLPISPAITSGIGVLLVIVFYNGFRIRFSPTLACIIVVTVCIGGDVHPVDYALSRIWDTAIGLIVGMLINTLVFPYDNARRIRSAVHSLDKEVMEFLSDMFDGDDHLPTADQTSQRINQIAREMQIFSNQRLLFHGKRHAMQLAAFRKCQEDARQLLAHMEVLSRMGNPGHLNQDNYLSLMDWGVEIPVPGEPVDPIVNYHVTKILQLRQSLLNALATQDGKLGTDK